MRVRLAFIVGFLLSFGAFGQLTIPLQHYYSNETDRIFLEDSSAKTYYSAHLSQLPILESRTLSDSLYSNYKKYYYWITQKIFKENFLIFKGKDFWCAVDPILDLEGGSNLAVDSSNFLFWNTRGVRVQAKFMDKVGFSSVFYENQAFVPSYIEDYVDSKGEFRVSGNNYKQDNAVIPGYARTKPFKTDGYDFAFAQGVVSIVPNKWFNVQFGNGNHFIGNGHRSLLLSDFTVNYPFLKFETNLWKDRIQYNAIYAIHQNLYRMPFYETVEATFERKIGTYHYLDFAITPNLTIGLFEGALWKRSDSLGTTQPNWLFINPIPFVNGIIMANTTEDYNAIFGLNASWVFGHQRIYGQAVLDEGKISALQAGFKTFDLFTAGLDIQVEYNQAVHQTYQAAQKRYNYTHYNLPLAHPLGAGFKEGIFRIKYEINGFFAQNRTVVYHQEVNDTLYDGTDLLNGSLSQETTNILNDRYVINNNLEAGYRFNKRYNLQAVIGWTYRQEQLPGERFITNYIYAGIRTALRNKTFDF